MSKKAPNPKDVKKVEDKPKVNYEEMILRNLTNPKMTLDHAGYHYINLNLNVLRK